MSVIRVRRLAGRNLPEAQAESLGASLAADPRALGAKALLVTGFVEVRAFDIDHALVHTRGKPLAEDIDLDVIARQTSGMTGADLANICNEAAIFAGREHRDQLLTRDFEAALERVVTGMQSRRVITDHEKKVVAYHEAGHALCSEMLPSVQRSTASRSSPAAGRSGTR